MRLDDPQWQAYFVWLQERGQLWPSFSSTNLFDESDGPSAPLDLLVVIPALSTQEEQSLFDKMIQATGLKEQETVDFVRERQGEDLADLLADLRDQRQPKRVLCFADQPHGWQETDLGGHVVKILATYHPRQLLTDPRHKRPCWQQLQQVVAEVKP